ncbi:MAG: cytochrome P450 [Paracoccus sp. (in: a-proteobacteria)]|uniref:cytochrome P450 n=1 Tax=Paracoccus sp. TaxID=267 RepID=UPI00391CEA44
MNMIEGHIAFEPAPGIPVWDIDPYDEAVLRDPHPYYAGLRARGPLVYIPRYSVLASGQYATTHEIFTDHDRFVSSRGVGLNDFRHGTPWRKPSIILEVDPPDHSRTRKVMSRALSPKAIGAFRETFHETAGTLLDQLLGKARIEAVTELAEAFPTTVFPRAVGMTDSDPRRLVDYGAMVFNAMGPDNQLRRRAMAQQDDIVPWITAACGRDRLTADGLGAIIYAAADTGEISADEAGMLVRSFLSAGVDTTVTGIGNMLWCLSQNPSEYEKLKRDPALMRPAIEEMLRHTSPVHTFGRTANEATTVAGWPVPEGAKIICVLGAANSDPQKWGDPELYRADRRPQGHMGFGAGIHGCVGQNIARAEIEALLTAMIARVDRIEPAGEPVWRPGNAIRALDRLPLTLIAT